MTLMSGRSECAPEVSESFAAQSGKFSRSDFQSVQVPGRRRHAHGEVLDFVHVGSSLSLRHFARLGSSLTVCGLARFGSSLAVLDFVQLGSSLSLRNYARLGSAVALLGMGRFGSVLSVLRLECIARQNLELGTNTALETKSTIVS